MDKKSIIKISSILIVFLIIVLLLLIKKNNTNKFEKIKDSELFYSLQYTINEEIMESNEYTNPSFIARTIYEKKHDLISYYIVNGYILDFIVDEQYNYERNVNYLLIVEGNTYNIKRIQTIQTDDIKSYEIDFENTKIDNNSSKLFKEISYSEQGKLSSYIANYLNLIEIDKNEALKLSKNNIYDYISITINSYTKQEYNDKTEYNIIDSNGNTILITEYSVNDYIIEVK